METSSAGAVTQRWKYFPFGREVVSTPQTGIRLRFTGHERDLFNTGGNSDDIDFMHARYMGPVIGRFLSVDPVLNDKRALFLPQAWNRYSYVQGNPLRAVDPKGEETWDVLSGMGNGASYSLGIGQLQIGGNDDYRLGQILGEIAGGLAQIHVGGSVAGGSLLTAPPSGGLTLAATAFGSAVTVRGGVFVIAGGIQLGQLLAQKLDDAGSGEGRNTAQDKKLTPGEIERLKKGGVDIHEVKGGKNASERDLYKDRSGNIYVKGKGGKGPGERTGLNLEDY